MRGVALILWAIVGFGPARAAGCRLGLSDSVEAVDLRAGSALAAVLQFGLASGVCFGVEGPDLDFLRRPVQIQVPAATVSYVVQSIVGSSRFQVSQEHGVVLLRGADVLRSAGQLDIVSSDGLPRAPALAEGQSCSCGSKERSNRHLDLPGTSIRGMPMTRSVLFPAAGLCGNF